MANPVAFHLRKWYLDLVTTTGEAAIVYFAHLHWNQLKLNYSALLHSPGGYQWTILHNTPPIPGSPWECPPLGISNAQWNPVLDGIPARQIADGVMWCCHQLRSSASMQIGDRTLEGTGYVESVEITEPPWMLPLQELHWGRFHGPESTLVWIDWRGHHPLRLFFDGAVERSAPQMSERQIIFEPSAASTLELHHQRTIRAGTLGHVLSAIPGLSSIPARILSADETKWLSRGVLHRPEQSLEIGWAIHEVVRWPPLRAV